MGLTSGRFAGVEELEACAVDDNAHLVPGSVGDHVALVQQALVDLGLDIPGGSDGVFGDNTAAAVLAYRTARDIRLPGQPVGSFVGKQTIAYLDREIDDFDALGPDCFSTGDPLVVLDLGDAPQAAVSALLGGLALGPFVTVADDGQAMSLTGDAVDPDGLARVAVASSDVLAGRSDGIALESAAAQLAGDAVLSQFPSTVESLVAGPAALIDLQLAASDMVAQLLGQSAAVGAVGAGGAVTPARDLSQQDALTEVLAAHAAGELTLSPDPAVTAPVVGALLSLAAPTLAGVTFLVAGSYTRRSSSYSPGSAPLQVLDARHLVGLLRLSRQLASTQGVTEIHHIGVNGDLGRLGGDCHQAGRACDFVGARGVKGGDPFLLTVYDDWFRSPVPDPDHPGKRLADWPHRTMRTSYRLADMIPVNPFVIDFWADLYASIAADFQDRTQSIGATGGPTSIGEPSSIMTPDHPTSHLVDKTETVVRNGVEEIRTTKVAASDGREAHNGHVHFQIGTTGKKLP